MGQMTPNQIEWRKRQVMEALQERPHHYQNPEHLHRRSYNHGDLRCTHCKKWLNPNIPEEAKEIKIAKRGMRIHSKQYCEVNSPYVAAMVMFAKFRPTRSKRILEIKRY
jgi:hypothetical protein